MTNIESILNLHGFTLINCDSSNNFGDYFKIYKWKDIEIRIVNSKSQLSFDIRKKNFEWFDLGIIKNMIYNDKNLNNKFELTDFYNLNIDKIKILFDNLNYKKTENKLIQLEKLRSKQIFKECN